jgi:uncharacterized repeat protein (TIGR02543 family)
MKNTMMLVLISLIACFLIIGCQDPITVEESNGSGVITVTIGGGNSRTILPWANALDSSHLTHKITISDGPGTAPPPQTLYPGSTNANFSVTPGKWTITVEAYYSEELVAFASETKQITSGKNTIKIQMQSVPLPLIDVTFDGSQGTFEGGAETRIQPVNKYNKAVEPDSDHEPTQIGQFFIGWYTSNTTFNQTTRYDFETAVTSPFTLYARWSNVVPFTVTFNKNHSDNAGWTDANPTSENAVSGETVNLPSHPTRTGYIFNSWNTRADGSGDTFTASTPVTGNITVYAQWTEDVPPDTGITITITASTTFNNVNIPHEIIIDGKRIFDDIKIDAAAIPYPAMPGEHTIVVCGYDASKKLISYADETVTVTVGNTVPCTMKMCQPFETSSGTDWDTAVAAMAISGGGNDKEYYIVVTGDFSIPGNQTFNASTVNIRGAGTISLTEGSTGSLLYIGTNQTVSLKETHLKGHSTNNRSLVYVDQNGTFNMTGGTISGNTNTNTDTINKGGGVYVYGGTFNMSGGTISDNTNTDTINYAGGGGVYVTRSGTFNMSGNAVINGNKAHNGGGVYLIVNLNYATATFNMTGGTISNNISTATSGNSGGGGIYTAGSSSTYGGTKIIINITSGTISGNSTADANGTYGGGIYLNDGTTTLTMSGGTISGNRAWSGGGVCIANYNDITFTMTGGTITGNNATLGTSGTNLGGGVFVQGGTFNLGSLDFITGNTALGTSPAPSNQVFFNKSSEGSILINGSTPDDSLKWVNGYAW